MSLGRMSLFELQVCDETRARLLAEAEQAIDELLDLLDQVPRPKLSKIEDAMSKMRKLQPKMKEIQERFAADKQRQQQEMMQLYQREKVNPLAGCLPILIQVPVFFALYKVLFVTIEMRHAPFFGWIKDLSAPDPTTIFNLFGLLPYDPSVVPVFGPYLMLGIWPQIGRAHV